MSANKKLTESTFNLHEYQSQIWDADLTKYRTLLMCAGEQGGKTILGALWLRRLIDEWKGSGANFIVGAPTYKIMEQSTKPTLQKVVTGYVGTFDGKDDAIRLHAGGSVYLRSSTDPDSVVGIPDCVGAWVDELGKCSRKFFLNIQSRTARMKGPILGTTTPYALNFVKKDIIDPYERGESPDTLYVRFSSLENPSYPKEEFDRLKRILPARVFRMRLEGYHDKAEGLIHEHWSEENWVESFVLPKGTRYFMGVDWGYDHPLAIVVRGITPDSYCYTVSLFKKSGLSVSQQIDLLKAKATMFHVELSFCGHDRPDMIDELNRRGVPASKYFEYSPNYREVRAGDQKHSEIIKSKQYKVFKGIDQWQDLEEEYQTYVWDKDEENDERGKEKPVDTNNDFMAAERYCTVGTMHLLPQRIEKPKIPIELAHRIDHYNPKLKKRGHWSEW